MKFFRAAFLIYVAIAFGTPLFGQRQNRDVYVDKAGVMRWGHNGEEVKGFGINYTAMFAHAYRTAKRLNISVEQAIDNDVYHFARLGLDLFRVHVWDTEISDSLGNLLDNENLRLFDYALAKMKERGMNFVITPIAYWGNGWPEPDDPTPGFSKKYGKDPCLTNPAAIAAQERYLFQFLNHVNRYTEIAYKDDPSIVAFEISNEPHHREEPAKVTAFIQKMVKSMRKTGCKKPIFYNISHSIHLVDAYFNGDIQGGTFQWYPTGLGAGHELGGNFLPNVDSYKIPFADHPKFRKAAKLVYEFDAADVGRSYIYPAMARSFRSAGIQVATHFAYDPTYMADVNTEYGTHYMNLVYAPQKALSLMISSEVFHQVPMYADYGKFPDNTSFGNFRVSYEEDLAEMRSETAFIYTNNTSATPANPDKLERIAGFGNSPVVKYNGAGAYFLDRIEDGVWRLEVMPDAIWLHDPFERTSPKKKIAAIRWSEWEMTINLDNLGREFRVEGINDGNRRSTNASNGTFTISPGTYFVVRKGVTPKVKPADKWGNIVLNEFAAPQSSLDRIFVSHKPVDLPPARDYVVRAVVAAPGKIESVQVLAWLEGFRPEVVEMTHFGANNYEVKLPGEKIREGTVRYHIIVKSESKDYTFPSGLQTRPGDWDFFDREPYVANVISDQQPLMLFNAATDAQRLTRQWTRNSGLVPSFEPGRAALHINVERLFTRDPENPNGEAVYDYSMRYHVGRNIGSRTDALSSKKTIVFRGKSLTGLSIPVQVALVTADGHAYGGIVHLETEMKAHELRIEDLQDVELVLLPRPYPTFLPYYFENAGKSSLDLRDVEVVQVSIGPGLPDDTKEKPQGIAIEQIFLK